MKESVLILKTRLVKIINIAKDIIVNAPINATLKLLRAAYRTPLTLLKDCKLTVNDKEVLSSLTNLTAISIIQGIKNYTDNCDEIYICGGGAFNKTILKYIQMEAEKVFNKIVIVKTTEDLNFSPKKVEAGLFAWLAMSKICNTKLDYRNVTGSNQTSVLGKVFY